MQSVIATAMAGGCLKESPEGDVKVLHTKKKKIEVPLA